MRANVIMSDLISKQQLELNKSLHGYDQSFGNRRDGSGFASLLPKALDRLHCQGMCDSLLDYGTGKGQLVERLRDEITNSIIIDGYDPAVEEWNNPPKRSYDIVTCLDVLEHVERNSLDAVLSDIASKTNKFCYLVIDLQPAVKTLRDGRNAHILLAPSDWWVTQISRYFTSFTVFPIYHMRGLVQKIVITASQDASMIPAMNLFLYKLQIFDFKMNGGILGKLKKIQ